MSFKNAIYWRQHWRKYIINLSNMNMKGALYVAFTILTIPDSRTDLGIFIPLKCLILLFFRDFHKCTSTGFQPLWKRLILLFFLHKFCEMGSTVKHFFFDKNGTHV